ncbi:Zn-ribbon-containing protein [Flocculibacter collagenilyticus]|uniref:Zn-ribbon-containing protein n=1 Tax=Flocculibacter collagenilyticus TaxID=2744479 RepID=UPI0018F3A49E|nr:Zn-ribbon-containing protein [Flocculibacter collagenilyticus]
MYVVELNFECFEDTTINAVETAIRAYFDALRNNGQILGREFNTAMQEGVFVTRVVCPEQDSLHVDNNSAIVNHTINGLNTAGVLAPKIKVIGVELQSDHTDPCTPPEFMILYTTFVHTCSPLRCGEHFSPVPLYRIPPIANGDHKRLLKWQEDWEACDQIQMNGANKVEFAALNELSNLNTDLFRKGQDLCKRIKCLTGIPVYYYLYRVGGESKESEHHRLCPSCNSEWKLPEPLHGIFDFKCDNCKLLSNISWDFQ